jgi:hypothetical protein
LGGGGKEEGKADFRGEIGAGGSFLWLFGSAELEVVEGTGVEEDWAPGLVFFL